MKAESLQLAVSLETLVLTMTYSLHTLRNSTPAAEAAPTGFARFANELALVGGFVALALWLMALFSYSPLDSAWSTSGAGSVIHNRAGSLGAWIADMGYFLLGYSVWWCVAIALRLWLGLLAQRLRGEQVVSPAAAAQPREVFWRRLSFWGGVAILLYGSTTLEWARLYRFESGLPGSHSGGVLGFALGHWSVQLLGFSGSAVLSIVLGVYGCSLVFGFSWMHVAERLGAWAFGFFEMQREKRELAEDRELGQKAVREREEVVFEEREEEALHHPALLRQETVAPETLEMTSRMIEKRLKDFGVEVRVVLAQPGPVITRYEIEPATGVKGSQIVGLAKDLARSLSLVSIRVVETIPGKNYMALELPNAKRQSIRLSEILGSEVYNEARSLLTMGLGKDIVGNPIVADLAKMPHVLVAGTTGSGKSVGINAMILSLLYKAEARDVRLLMIDPKMLEMSVYEGIPHLLAPVVTDMRQAAHGLNWCVAEMERRYKLMSKMGVRNLAGYNQKIDDAKAKEEFIYNPFSLTPESPEPLARLPHIVVVIDELADLMMVVGKKIEELIARLAQKARAAGIHLILATQRPSVDVITGLIKANIPTRIAFQVSSKIDSRTILDQMGAEALLGMGDMLYMPSGTGLPIRVHGAFVSDDEVHRVVSYLKSQGEPDYIEGVLEGGTVDGEEGASGAGADAGGEKDPMYDQAVEVVLKNRKASISLVQRHLKIGYNRAARLVEEMEKAGLVSAMSSSGQRDILVPNRNNENA